MSENQKYTTQQLHKTCTGVYAGTRQLPIKEQRGKKYVNFQGKQVNLKDIPKGFAPEEDDWHNHVFNYGFRDRPNTQLDLEIKNFCRRKIQPQEKTTITIIVGLKTGEKQIFEIDKSADIREWLKDNNISYKYFKFHKE